MSESVQRFEYEVEDGVYSCRGSDVHEIVRPWGAEAGAWRRLGTHGWHPFWPRWTIDELEQELNRFSAARRIPSGCQKQWEAYRFLLDSWPESAKQIARPFTQAQWPLLQFINLGGSAARELIASNPAIGLLSAIAVCPRETGLTSDSAAEASHLLALRRRQIAGRLGFPAAEATVRLLGKIPKPCVSVEVLDSLKSLLAESHHFAERLAHLPRIHSVVLAVCADPALRDLFPFELLGRFARLRPDAVTEDLLVRLRSRIEEHRAKGGPPLRFKSIEDLETVTGSSLKSTALRQRRSFPTPPLADSAHIHSIRSAAELIAEGRELRHCTETNLKYALQVSRGLVFFYRLLEPERATLCVRRTETGWHLDEVRGPGNRHVDPATLLVIQAWIEQQSKAALMDPHRSPDLSDSNASPTPAS